MDDQAYRDEVQHLKSKWKEAEGNMIAAATHGKTLLEENVVLKEQIAAMQKQRDSDAERFAQEIHSLRSKVEMLNCEAISRREDEEALAKKCESLEQAMEAEIALKQRIVQKNADLEAELLTLSDRASRAEGEKGLHEKLISEMELAFARQASESQENLDQKLIQLEEENRQWLATIAGLEQEVARRDKAQDDLKSKCEVLESRVAALEEELEGKECEASCYFNALERCRQEVSDLKAEMSVEKAPEADVNKRGNSLFSEIEDRRQMLEKQAAHMREKYLAMRAEHRGQLAQIMSLKQRNATLERNISHRVDASYAERLEDDLAAAQREIDTLRSHMQYYNAVVDTPKRQPEAQAHPVKQGGSDYGWLSVMLDKAKQRVAQQEQEKKSLFQKYALERDEAQEHRRRLHHLEKAYGSVAAENLKLRAEKQELMDKHRISSTEDSPAKADILGLRPEFNSIEGSPEKAAILSLQTQWKSKVAMSDIPGLGSSDSMKSRPDASGGKENILNDTTRRGNPAGVVVKRNECKQQ